MHPALRPTQRTRRTFVTFELSMSAFARESAIISTGRSLRLAAPQLLCILLASSIVCDVHTGSHRRVSPTQHVLRTYMYAGGPLGEGLGGNIT